MHYLMIENPTECPVEGFVMLGVSTARGDADKIGQFGSGNKLGMLVLLRFGLNPVIFSGEQMISVYTKPQVMNGKQYNRVYYRDDNGEHATTMSTDFGSMDWDDVGMALREFVSNAIDSSPDIDGVNIDIFASKEPEGKAGYTRVFIPLTPDVQKWYNQLNEKFLHWRGEQNTSILSKHKKSPPSIYRKGVFVREVKTDESVFNYNFGDDVKIDETRNMTDYDVKHKAAKLLFNNEHALKTVFEKFKEGKFDFWEAKFNHWSATGGCQDIVQKIFFEVFGKQAVIYNKNISLLAGLLVNRGFTPVPLPENWYTILKGYSIQTDMHCLTMVESSGNEIVEPPVECVRKFNIIWLKLKKQQLVNGKDKPELKCFIRTTTNNTHLCGYYQSGVVYLNVDNATNPVTIVEELVHHISGADDETRDFQNFTLTALCKVMSLL